MESQPSLSTNDTNEAEGSAARSSGKGDGSSGSSGGHDSGAAADGSGGVDTVVNIMMVITFTGCFICARDGAEGAIFIASFCPQNNPMKPTLFLSVFFQVKKIRLESEYEISVGSHNQNVEKPDFGL